MKIVIHPINNRFDFGILFAVVGWFIASFWVVAALPVTPFVATFLFGANIAAIGIGMMAYARHVQSRNAREAQHVGQVAIEVSAEERSIIERLRIPCKLHRYSSWPKGAPERVHRYWAEFADDDAKVLFMMARPVPQKQSAPSFPNAPRNPYGLVGPQTRLYVPPSWLKPDGDNEIMLFDEHGFDPSRVRLIAH